MCLTCCEGGELHFLQIGGVSEDVDDGDMFIDAPVSKGAELLPDGVKSSSHPCSPGGSGELFTHWPLGFTLPSSLSGSLSTCASSVCAAVDLLVDQPLTTESLMALVELTCFETLTPRFSATVPPCWVEVQQEQQQRRHPQHLHQQHHGDAAQHTRTWKLQSDR